MKIVIQTCLVIMIFFPALLLAQISSNARDEFNAFREQRALNGPPEEVEAAKSYAASVMEDENNAAKSPQAQLKDAAASDPACLSVPKSDQEYAQRLAENGDLDAQYFLGAFYDKSEHGSISHTYSDEAVKWFRMAADQGYVKAQGWFCDRYLQLRGREGGLPDTEVEWCKKAAAHGHNPSQSALGYLYMSGVGVPQDIGKSYFWYKLADKPTENFLQVRQKLAPNEISKIDEEARNWKPEQPAERRWYTSVLKEETHILHDRSLIPLNIAGMMCGGESKDCQAEGICGNLVAIKCPRHPPVYIVADRQTKATVNQCSMSKGEYCKDILPKEWSCELPANMPPAMLDRGDVITNTSTLCKEAVASTQKMSPLLQGLKEVNLHVALLSRDYNEILKCHGREEECTKGRGIASDSEGFQSYVAYLKKSYKAFPKGLKPENVTGLFSGEVENVLAPLVGAACIPFKVINDAPVGGCIDVTTMEEEVYCRKKRLGSYIGNPEELTFSVTIKIVNDSPFENPTDFGRHPYFGPEDGPDPRIAVVTWTPIRKTCTPRYLDPQTQLQEVIPLSMGDDEIARRLVRMAIRTRGFLNGQVKERRGYDLFSCEPAVSEDKKK